MGSLLLYILSEFTKCSEFYTKQKFTTKAMQSQEKFKYRQLLPITSRAVLPKVDRFTATVIPAA